ncbi:metallophosphoesterase family protein [Tumebacillus permanentifrigoris]|uniref:Calcineurin-like phosphoesterase family protein n=1 Tax=Tumebacillus permanentifrigoris TaxID=378543 RepID=A0A316DTQ5_9BACL|nr:metallophosphoesterase [Tumebacillus permanentifrigoris]PWK11271.1 calcineurin-like phosphoesterase family protein [Tumebacillus permanentifrigoris]
MNRSIQITFAVVVALLLCCVLTPAQSFYASPSRAERVEKPLASFGVLSDVHVVSDWQPAHLNGALKFANALRDLRTYHPDFIVVNGDLTTNGSPEDLSLAREIANDHAGCPLYPTMGNHDYYHSWDNPSWSDARAQAQFLRTFSLPNLYYDKWVHGAHLIFLSSEQYFRQQKERGEAAWLSNQQLHWFANTLRSAPAAPTFVFLHQPLDGTVGKSDPDVSAVQSVELLDLASHYPHIVWFSGHSHIDAEAPSEAVVKRGVHFYGLGSVYEPIELTADPTPGSEKRGEGLYLHPHPERSESRFVELYPDRIVIKTRLHHLATWSDQVETIPLR